MTTGRTIIVNDHFDLNNCGRWRRRQLERASSLPSLFQAEAIQASGDTATSSSDSHEEEAGLIGLRFYARAMTPEELATTDAMINMDTLGLALLRFIG